MTKLNKAFVTVFIITLASFIIWGGFLLYSTGKIDKTITNNLPILSTPGTVNLPGKLEIPAKENHAQNISALKILEWTNFYRAQEGLPKLTSNPILVQAAQTKVDDMFENQYFEHVSPTGISPDKLVLSVGYNYRVTGENLALGDFKDEKDLVDAWMASPGHRANILNPDYTEIGISSGLNKFSNRGTTWISVQEFGKPAPNCAKPDAELAQKLEQKKSLYDRQIAEYQQFLNNRSGWGSDEKKEAKKMQDALDDLYQEITILIAQYNIEVDNYNQCIK